ncbi:MAG: M50 family metallopeptidase [Thiolinea sp.]
MNLDQRQYDDRTATTGEALTLYGMVGVFLLLMGLEIFSNYEPRKMAALMFLLWWMPLVLLHEFGHALMTRLLGWEIERTVVGFGRVVYQGQLFGAPLEVRMIPIEGFVQISSLGQAGARLQNALIYFAGPGIELLLFVLIATFLGWGDLLRIEDDYGRLALQSLAFAALVGAVINLIPMGVVTKDGESPNDGLGILQSLFGKARQR